MADSSSNSSILDVVSGAVGTSGNLFSSNIQAGAQTSQNIRQLMMQEQMAPLQRTGQRWQNKLLMQQWLKEQQKLKWREQLAVALARG